VKTGTTRLWGRVLTAQRGLGLLQAAPSGADRHPKQATEAIVSRLVSCFKRSAPDRTGRVGMAILVERQPSAKSLARRAVMAVVGPSNGAFADPRKPTISRPAEMPSRLDCATNRTIAAQVNLAARDRCQAASKHVDDTVASTYPRGNPKCHQGMTFANLKVASKVGFAAAVQTTS
jgi:hypothetical protein